MSPLQYFYGMPSKMERLAQIEGEAPGLWSWGHPACHPEVTLLMTSSYATHPKMTEPNSKGQTFSVCWLLFPE